MNNQITVNEISVLLFRVTLSGIFIAAGINHLADPHKVAKRILNANQPAFTTAAEDLHLLAVLSGYALLIFGLGLLMGIFTRWSALILSLLLIPITLTIQMGSGILHGPLWKNVALFGGLWFFILNNPKVYSLYNK